MYMTPVNLQRYCLRITWERILEPKLQHLGLEFSDILLIYEEIPLKLYVAFVKVRCLNYLDIFSWKCDYVKVVVGISPLYKIHFSIHIVTSEDEMSVIDGRRVLLDKRLRTIRTVE